MAIPENILIAAQKLAPSDAIKFFKAQGLKLTGNAEATAAAVQERLFAVTQATNMQVLQDMRDAIAQALDEGQTFVQFQKDIENTLAKKGWTGSRTVINAEGVATTIQTTPWRLKTIYNTNVQSSLNAGRFERQVENADDRPFLELIDGVLGADRSRATHKGQSGSIQPITSNFWKSPNSWYPPNGFNCTGRTSSLTRVEARSRGIKIKLPGAKPDAGFGANPATQFFKPKREDFDDDIWEAGQDLEPADLE